MPLEVGDVVVDGWMLVMELAGGGSRLVLVDCWPEAAYDSIHEEEEQEEEHWSSTFVVVAPAVNENMAADRNKQHCLGGRGAGMVDCMLCWRRRTRTVYVLRSLKQMVGVVVDGSSWRMSMRSWVGRGGQQNNFTINNRIVNGNGNCSRFLDIRRNNCKVGRIFLGSFMLVLIVFKIFKNC